MLKIINYYYYYLSWADIFLFSPFKIFFFLSVEVASSKKIVFSNII